jgi:superfamily II DNA or RNA helicase
MYDLRPYQTDGVAQIRHAFKSGSQSPLYVLPTGGGKTVLFSYIAASAASRGKNVWILVHRIELIRQTSRKLHEAGISHGIINPKFSPNYRQPLQVASVQSLVKRMGRIPNKPDLIIVDEAHHANANTWARIITANPQAKILGVTATPCRTDQSGLGVKSGGFFDRIIIGPQIYELIRGGFLSKPIVYAPGAALDLSGIRHRGGDFAQDDLAALMDRPTITGDAVKHYTKLCAGQPAIVFCVSVDHARHVAAQFRDAGYRFYHVDGGMDDAERTRILDGLGNGTVDGVTSCELISEGTDIPAVACAVLLRPTESLGMYLQQVGRALRPAPGKPHAIILDHVGNVMRHGLPDEHRDWSLEAEPKKRGKKSDEPKTLVKQCPSCYAIHEPAPVCPVCKHEYVSEGREVDQVDGELREITEADKERIRADRFREQRAAQSLEDLKELARRRGYKPGWADHIYLSRQKKTG